jgi:hypothetical protein
VAALSPDPPVGLAGDVIVALVAEDPITPRSSPERLDPVLLLGVGRRPGARVASPPHADRARVLNAAYAATPERFVRHPPRPPALPTAAWINKPNSEEPAH